MKQKTYNIRNNSGTGGNEQSLVLEGDLSIRNSPSILKALQGAKLEAETNIISLKNVEKLDITTLQLLWSLKKKIEGAGKKLVFDAELSADIRRLMANTGFSSTF